MPNSNYRVYIPTRNRIHNVQRIVPRWLAQGFDVVLVVDPRDKAETFEFVKTKGWPSIRGWQNITSPPGVDKGYAGQCGVTVIAPPGKNGGFGYLCDFAARHARNEAIDVFVLSDDDLMPKTDANEGQYMQLLVDELRNRPDYLGLGAVRDYHNLMTRNYTHGPVSEHFGKVILCPAGWGQQCYALNTAKLFEVGGFDTRLTCFGEGHDLIRKSVTYLHKPWLVHAGVYVQPLGKRYEEGGLNTYAKEQLIKMLRIPKVEPTPVAVSEHRKRLENECKAIIYKDWPEYTTPGGMVRWKKMYDECIPNWRDMSALHGGELPE